MTYIISALFFLITLGINSKSFNVRVRFIPIALILYLLFEAFVVKMGYFDATYPLSILSNKVSITIIMATLLTPYLNTAMANRVTLIALLIGQFLVNHASFWMFSYIGICYLIMNWVKYKRSTLADLPYLLCLVCSIFLYIFNSYQQVYIEVTMITIMSLSLFNFVTNKATVERKIETVSFQCLFLANAMMLNTFSQFQTLITYLMIGFLLISYVLKKTSVVGSLTNFVLFMFPILILNNSSQELSLIFVLFFIYLISIIFEEFKMSEALWIKPIFDLVLLFLTVLMISTSRIEPVVMALLFAVGFFNVTRRNIKYA